MIPSTNLYDKLPIDSEVRRLCTYEGYYLGDRPKDINRKNGVNSKDSYDKLITLLSDDQPRCLKLVGYFQNIQDSRDSQISPEKEVSICKNELNRMWPMDRVINNQDQGLVNITQIMSSIPIFGLDVVQAPSTSNSNSNAMNNGTDTVLGFNSNSNSNTNGDSNNSVVKVNTNIPVHDESKHTQHTQHTGHTDRRVMANYKTKQSKPKPKPKPKAFKQKPQKPYVVSKPTTEKILNQLPPSFQASILNLSRSTMSHVLSQQVIPTPNDVCIYLRCLPKHYHMNSILYYDTLLDHIDHDGVIIFENPQCSSSGSGSHPIVVDSTVKALKDHLYHRRRIRGKKYVVYIVYIVYVVYVILYV